MRGRIVDLVRAGNRDGNPVWAVTLDGGRVVRTEPGAQVAYSIDNSEYAGVDVDLTLNAAGRIVGIATA